MMWFSWTVIAMLQIIFTRYNKQNWRWSQFLHNFFGISAGVLTLIAWLIMMSYKNWTVSLNVFDHALFGMIFFALTLLMVMGGFFGWLRRNINRPWQTANMLKFKRIHMYFAYFVFFFVQTAVVTGILARAGNLNQSVGSKKGGWLVTLNLLIWGGVMSLMEFKHRRFLKEDYEYHIKRSTPNFTSEDFNLEVKKGRRLVILNEYVVDIGEFTEYHPGGKFVMCINVGRDISKFFYGGYCLEDNNGGRPAEGHNHSNYARMIV